MERGVFLQCFGMTIYTKGLKLSLAAHSSSADTVRWQLCTSGQKLTFLGVILYFAAFSSSNCINSWMFTFYRHYDLISYYFPLFLVLFRK